MGINVYGHITQVTHTTCLSVDSLCVGCSVIGLHYNDIKELDISSCFPDMPRHNVQQSHTVHGTNLISQDASILLKMSLTPNKMSDNSGNAENRENQAHCLKESFFLFFSPPWEPTFLANKRKPICLSLKQYHFGTFSAWDWIPKDSQALQRTGKNDHLKNLFDGLKSLFSMKTRTEIC